MRHSRITTIIMVVVILVLLMGIKTYYDAGEFKHIESSCDCKCTEISGIPGPEDIDVDYQSGIAYISSDDRASALKGNVLPGAIYSYDLKNFRMRKLTGNLHFDFHPHGIELYKTDDGRKLLFVVNHRRRGHYIEIFEIKKRKLLHRESIRDKQMLTSPNDISVVNERMFYVTNDHGYTSKFGKMIEEYLQVGVSYVLFFDGKRFRKVAEKLKYANGIKMNKNGDLVYVAAPVAKLIRVFSRDIETSNLTFLQDIHLNSGVDNIHLDPAGKLWAACHPKLLTFVRHSKDPSLLSPSQVIVISFKGVEDYSLYEVFTDTGELLSGSTIAVPYDNMFLIGSVFDDHLLRCEKLK